MNMTTALAVRVFLNERPGVILGAVLGGRWTWFAPPDRLAVTIFNRSGTAKTISANAWTLGKIWKN